MRCSVLKSARLPQPHPSMQPPHLPPPPPSGSSTWAAPTASPEQTWPKQWQAPTVTTPPSCCACPQPQARPGRAAGWAGVGMPGVVCRLAQSTPLRQLVSLSPAPPPAAAARPAPPRPARSAALLCLPRRHQHGQQPAAGGAAPAADPLHHRAAAHFQRRPRAPLSAGPCGEQSTTECWPPVASRPQPPLGPPPPPRARWLPHTGRPRHRDHVVPPDPTASAACICLSISCFCLPAAAGLGMGCCNT